jgi:hypothetical protein
MTQAMPTSSTGRFLNETTVFTDAPGTAAAAVTSGDTRGALAHAERLAVAAEQLRQEIVRDALHGGADWWEVARMLGTHPQAAFDGYAHLVDHRRTPAEQRPDLAVVLTAGLAADHDMQPGYGIDLADLTPDHSVHAEPAVRGIRDAAELLGADVWIAVSTPGGFEGAEGDPTPGTDAIKQWTSVVTHLGELTWLREAIALNAPADTDGDLD